MKFRSIYILFFAFILSFSSCNSQESKPEANNSDAESKLYVSGSSYSEQEQNSTTRAVTASRQNAITNAVQKVSPAIVGINVTEVRKVQVYDPFMNDPFFRHFFGERKPRYRKYELSGLGSGFLISPDGYILTNHHVAGNASEVIITTTGGETYDAEIIGSDKVSDVALLKIDGKDLPYLKLGNSKDIMPGEWVIAFGNPFGLFDINAKPTVTVGVVSNIGVNMFQEGRVYKGMIQTDAAISSGNSGGPLVNSLGEVIAMNTIIFSTAQTRQGAGSIGIGFAIPIDRVKKIVDKLKDEGEINRNYVVGIEVKKVDERIKEYFDLESTEGVVVVNLYRNTPAEKAGIEPGDIILEIEGMKIMREEDFLIAINEGEVGDKLTMKIKRNGKIMTKTVKLVERKR